MALLYILIFISTVVLYKLGVIGPLISAAFALLAAAALFFEGVKIVKRAILSARLMNRYGSDTVLRCFAQQGINILPQEELYLVYREKLGFTIVSADREAILPFTAIKQLVLISAKDLLKASDDLVKSTINYDGVFSLEPSRKKIRENPDFRNSKLVLILLDVNSDSDFDISSYAAVI